MLHLHQVDGFGYALRFIPIYGFRSSRRYRTKSAATRAYISQDHESRCSFAPAFAHIGAIAALTNGMKLMLVYQAAYMLVVFTNGKLYPEPVWFFGLGMIRWFYSWMLINDRWFLHIPCNINERITINQVSTT